MDVNQNIPECIKSTDHIGSTTYYNICAHTQIDVAWGAFGWFEVALVIAIALAIILLLGGIAFRVVFGDFL